MELLLTLLLAASAMEIDIPEPALENPPIVVEEAVPEPEPVDEIVECSIPGLVRAMKLSMAMLENPLSPEALPQIPEEDKLLFVRSVFVPCAAVFEMMIAEQQGAQEGESD